jgi:hypothetical protein
MKNRLYLVCGVMLVAAAGWAAWQALQRPDEPVYQGKRLSIWLEILSRSKPFSV